jgi:hypothetical protein
MNNDLQNMTIEQLKQLRKDNYELAQSSGILVKIANTARVLGVRLQDSYGPKYGYIFDNIKIYVDDYGNYMNVDFKGKEVCSTHATKLIFIPGKWQDEVLVKTREAEDILNKQITDKIEKERQELIKEMSLPE